MSFQKIKTGQPDFDNLFQGVYLGRPTLLSGKRRSGVSTHVFLYLAHLIQIGEKVLLFTEEAPDRVALEAHGLGVDVAEAVRRDQLLVVPYDRQLPLLPFPEALDELRELIVGRHCSFVFFDPVIPWLAAPSNLLSARLDAFFGLLDETAPTSLLVLRHPVSPLARRLYDEVAERCPICCVADQPTPGTRTLELVKYMGAPPGQFPIVVPVLAGPANASGGLQPPPENLTFHSLHDATQRIQLNLDSLFPGDVPSAGGFFAPPAPPRPQTSQGSVVQEIKVGHTLVT